MEKKPSKKVIQDDIEIVSEDSQIYAKLEKLKRELAACKKEKEEYLKGWQRAKADFINSEKNSRQESKELVRNAEIKILNEVLTLVDNFEKAFLSDPPDTQWVGGIKNIHELALSILKSYGITEIETKAKKFDPFFHEAIAVVETDNEDEDGEIIQEVQRGYIRDKDVIRPAKVQVKKIK
jgi:molecular chaperone GrpE